MSAKDTLCKIRLLFNRSLVIYASPARGFLMAVRFDIKLVLGMFGAWGLFELWLIEIIGT
jgi:hypothetical protein